MSLDELKDEWKNIDDPNAGQEKVHEDQMKQVELKGKSIHPLKLALPQLPFLFLYTYLLLSYIVFIRDFQGVGYKTLFVSGIILSVVVPVMAIRSLVQFYKEGELTDTYSNSLKLVEKQCERLKNTYYILLVLNILLLLVSVILMPKIYTEYLSHQTTAMAFIVGALIVCFVSYQLFKYYKRQIERNDAFLKTIQWD